jgi:hypothetical protein
LISFTSSFFTRSVKLISVFLQHHISKLPEYFLSTCRSVHVPTPHKANAPNLTFY